MDPFIVHAPADWRKLAKLLASERAKAEGFTARYRAACTGRQVELPPNVKVCIDENGPYFVAGPHERYYAKCEACEPADDKFSG